MIDIKLIQVLPAPVNTQRTVRFDKKRITLHFGAIELLGIKEGDFINILQEEGEPRNIFIKKSESVGYVLHKRHNTLQCNCAKVMRRVLDTFDCESAVFKISEPEKTSSGETVYPLLTRINFNEK